MEKYRIKNTRTTRYSQNIQVCIWFGDKVWRAKIVEFRITWTETGIDWLEPDVELIGQKDIVSTMRDTACNTVQRMDFYPLFTDDLKIKGSQLVWMLENNSVSVVNLENFENKDFQFKNEFTKFGYKIYNKRFKYKNNFLLVEARLQNRVLDQGNFFSDFDKSRILHDQLKSLQNLVPLDLESYLNKPE